MNNEMESQVAQTRRCLNTLSSVCRDYLARSYTQTANEVVDAFGHTPGPDALTAIRLASDFVTRAITLEARTGSRAPHYGSDALVSINDIILLKSRPIQSQNSNDPVDFSPFAS